MSGGAVHIVAVLQHLAADTPEGLSLTQGVALAIASALSAVAVSYGVIKTKIDTLEKTSTDHDRKGGDVLARLTKLEIDHAGLRPVVDEQTRSSGRISGEIGAMEGRLGLLITEKFDGLRRELRAGGALKDD